jgi:tetratricopeptide (TPR) repeat protein
MVDTLYDDVGIDLHIVTSTAEGTSIEELAEQTFQRRQIGAGAPTGGLLIILNPKLARARIEVGYSLEGALTDLHMGRIARDQLAPYTSYAIAGMAVMDVLHYLRDHVYLSAALGNLELDENLRAKPGYQEYAKFLAGGAGAQTSLSSKSVENLKVPVPSAQRARYAAATKPEESVAAFLRATGDLAGDPTLDLFTEGSRLMRTHYPLARFEEVQRLERIQASMPLVYHLQGNYAVATSKRPAKGFVPILLHREQGLWRIDLVETWKNLFFDDKGEYFLRNSNTPYAFGLAQFGRGQHYDIASLSLGGDSIATRLAALEGRNDTVAMLRRAEIWLRNAFVFPQAFLAYEAARRSAPKDPLVLQTLGERALYLGFPELAIPALEKVGAGVELSLAEAYASIDDYPGAQRWVARALKDNPYDWYALHRQKWLAEKTNRADEAQRAADTIVMLTNDPARRTNPVTLSFSPAVPKFEPNQTLNVNGTTVYDHSKFSVRMHNTSAQPVEIESVRLKSVGTAAASGLGDIRDYWQFPNGRYRLLPGESVVFDKQWGFTVDTGHEHVRYVFRACWHGTDSTETQCRTQWVDTMP